MSHTQPTILLADNDPSYLQVAKEFLEGEGYRIRTAGDPTTARRMLEQEPIDLAILDVRLRDDTDENDLTGLDVAKEVRPEVPKIMLTLYPGLESVRQALSPMDNGGGPPAVGYIDKKEGFEPLLRAVRLALLPLPPVLEKNILRAFKAPALVALHNRISEVKADETTLRLQQGFEQTSSELRAHRERESLRASDLHRWGLYASVLGIALIVAACVLVIAGSVTGAVVTLVAGTVSNAIKLLFSQREDEAHRRVAGYYHQLDEAARVDLMLGIGMTLETPQDRDAYKKKIIDHLLSERWLVKPAPDGGRRLPG